MIQSDRHILGTSVFFILFYFLNVQNENFVPNVCLYRTTNCQQLTGTKEVFTVYWTQNHSSLCKILLKISTIYIFIEYEWCVNIWSLGALLFLWLCFGYCVTGHFKRLSVPFSHSDVKVIEITIQQGCAFLSLGNLFFVMNWTEDGSTLFHLQQFTSMTKLRLQHALILKGQLLQNCWQ